MIYIQYQKAEKLKQLIEQLKPILTIDANSFYNDFFNILTCTTIGLDNWGVILNQFRGVPISSNIGTFGFYKDSSAWLPKPKNFNRGGFYKKRLPGIVELNDVAYRHVLLFTYASQTINNSVGSANQILNYYYQSIDPLKKVWVKENTNIIMSIDYFFNFTLHDYERNIYTIAYGLLPRPAGVGFTITENAIF